MSSNQNESKPSDGVLTPREVTYRESLIRVTHIGGIIAGILFSFFILLYWIIDFPRVTVVINIASLVIDLIGLVLITRFRVHKLAAHLFTFATYFSLLGTTLYTGGIDGSSMVWVAFLPIAATIMAGTTDGLVWGAISVSTIAGIYVLNRMLGIDVTLLPSKSMDRMIDLIAVTSVTGTAIWLNEKAKARAMNHLETAQALLNHLAMVDPLTNVFNRRYFFDRAKVELEIASLQESHTSILLLDIDHFKKVNDSYGHNVGDQILTGLVALCQENLREMDTLARLGGEEFVILLPETDLAEARHIAERLRRTLEHTPINTDSGLQNVTVSIGLMSHPTSGAELPVDKLVQRADQAMYLAKRAGRNRVVTWQSQESTHSSTD
jgi:diguanylate cyclase (GGDEF)-like protein